VFQSTLPQGERPPLYSPSCAMTSVSIHAPAGGATLSWKKNSMFSVFQSTLPQGERH